MGRHLCKTNGQEGYGARAAGVLFQKHSVRQEGRPSGERENGCVGRVPSRKGEIEVKGQL